MAGLLYCLEASCRFLEVVVFGVVMVRFVGGWCVLGFSCFGF